MESGTKRPWVELEPDIDQDQPQTRRMRPMPFFSVIRGALMAESIKGICSSLEPVIRKVVHEEVQLLVCGTKPLYGNRQYFIEQPAPTPEAAPFQNKNSPRHKLVFANQIPPAIFTGNNITDNHNHPIQIQLVDTKTGEICKNVEGSPIKVKIVVIDGDLEVEGLDSDKFSSKVVKPRDGRRPLLVGNTEVTLNDGVGIIKNLSLSDNSKWLRCGKFRLGAYVDSDRSKIRIEIEEGLTEKFAVKDQRGEHYKKHYPPMLDDEVWRLEIIAKDGKYHQRLKEKGVNNVRDFLTLCNSNQSELKKILKMSKNNWDKVVKHARTCPMGLDNTDLSFNGNNSNLPNGNGGKLEARTRPIFNGPESPYLGPDFTGLDFDVDSFWSPDL